MHNNSEFDKKRENYFLKNKSDKNIKYTKNEELKTINNFIYADKEGNELRRIKIVVKVKK